MLTKQEKSHLRNQLFRHLDGIVTCPSAFVLFDKGITKYLLENKKVTLYELAEKFKANDGYLNVALRTLCSQGWLDQNVDNTKNIVTYSYNENSQIAFQYFSIL